MTLRLSRRNKQTSPRVTPPGSAAILAAEGTTGTGTGSVSEDAISDQFIRQHYAGLHALLRRRIGDPAVAAEMLNEADCHRDRARTPGPGRGARAPGGLCFSGCDEPVSQLPPGVRQVARSCAPGAMTFSSCPAQSPRTGWKPAWCARFAQSWARCRRCATARSSSASTWTRRTRRRSAGPWGWRRAHFDKVIFRARQRLRVLLEAQGFSKSDLLGMLLVCFA